ncbi:MAG: hypothetical protein HY043_20635 [Verrucomicrobia bacterium]|nr:hypothetical protein [Verrucomicrobiota bacterium]
MNVCRKILLCLTASALLLLSSPVASACAACFGKSDSKLAEGMNWGIASLLVVVVGVLGGVAAFFIFLAKKSAALAESTASAPSSSVSQ